MERKSAINKDKVIKGLECCIRENDGSVVSLLDNNADCENCPYHYTDGTCCCKEFEESESSVPTSIIADALALLKEQDETINNLTDTIRQLHQHIKDLSEYMTPYGKVEDVKAYAELLKEHEAVEPFHRCIGKEFSLIEDSHFDYCPYCGKPITWVKQEGR